MRKSERNWNFLKILSLCFKFLFRLIQIVITFLCVIVQATSITYFVIIPLFCNHSLLCNHPADLTSLMWLCGVYQWKLWLIRNLMVVSEIWDISPFLFFINFESPSLTLGVFSKLIKSNLGDISQITLTSMLLIIQILSFFIKVISPEHAYKKWLRKISDRYL